jgi:N-acetylmuramoyl-L-alanine amidase
MKINVHGGHSLKCRGASGLLDEVNEDRKVKNKVIELLRANGHTVYDCTDDNGKDQNSNLKAIVNKCNKHKVDLDVSIHLNDGGGTGTEVYVYSDNSKAKDEATRIAEKISNTLGIRNRGVKTSTKLYVLRKTKSPSLLIECCFVDNATDKAKWNVDKCAKAIVEGVLNATVNNVTHAEAPKPTPAPAPSDNITKLNYDGWVARLQTELNNQFHKGLNVDGLRGSKTLDACVTVKRGAKGNITRLIQERLNSVGFHISTDGIFGGGTENAVKVFQRNRGLSADGIVGRKTWDWLLRGTRK